MSSKVMVVISTAEKDKALTGILYAKNAQKNNWVEPVTRSPDRRTDNINF